MIVTCIIVKRNNPLIPAINNELFVLMSQCKSKDVKWVARQVENEDCMMQADEEHSRMQVLSIVTGTLAEDRTEQ